jgi:hypothetical protein
MASQSRVAANRRNAGKSTGPQTREGKEAVSQNALKHGLLARRDVIPGEDPAEFQRHREATLAELAPAGRVETALAERIVRLTWRLERADRMQNEAFEYLLAKDAASGYLRQLREERNPSAGKEIRLGRVAADDFANARILDRLMMYEERIEGSLRRTLGDLCKVRLMPARQATDQSPAGTEATTDSAKQSQFSAADGGQSPPCKKDDVSCETKPMGPAGPVCSVPVRASEETPYGVTTSEACPAEAENLSHQTNPICGTLHMEEPPIQALPAGA